MLGPMQGRSAWLVLHALFRFQYQSNNSLTSIQLTAPDGAGPSYRKAPVNGAELVLQRPRPSNVGSAVVPKPQPAQGHPALLNDRAVKLKAAFVYLNEYSRSNMRFE